MGHSEWASLGVCIRIKIKDLIESINDDNRKKIWKILMNTSTCIIEDDNENFNDVYQTHIIDEYKEIDPEHYNAAIIPLTIDLKKYGNRVMMHYGGEEQETFEVRKYSEDSGCLFNQYLLYNMGNILHTERWGYSREGDNVSSTNIDLEEIGKLQNKANEIASKLTLKIIQYLSCCYKVADKWI